MVMKWWGWDSNSGLIWEPVLIPVYSAASKIFLCV